MKSFLVLAFLSAPAVHGAPRHFTVTNANVTPPKARVVSVQPSKSKIYVSTSGASPVAKSKANPTTKGSNPTHSKAARPAAPRAHNWRFVPKFEEGGKDDTTYGFLLKRRF